QYGCDDLRFVGVTLGEQWADGPVDEARREHLVDARAPFTLEESAGNLAGGKSFFLVLAGEWKEIDALAGLIAGDGGHEHARVVVAHQDGAVRLFGVFPLLKEKPAAPQLDPSFSGHVFVPLPARSAVAPAARSCLAARAYGSE